MKIPYATDYAMSLDVEFFAGGPADLCRLEPRQRWQLELMSSCQILKTFSVSPRDLLVDASRCLNMHTRLLKMEKTESVDNGVGPAMELDIIKNHKIQSVESHKDAAVHWKRKKRPKATVLKANNFLYFAGAGSVLPYLSVYFLHYTDASEKEFGRIMSIAAVFGTILNLIVSSLGDKYRAHRLIYLLTLLTTYLAVSFLFVPILTSDHHGYQPHQQEANQTEAPQNATTTAPLLPLTTTTVAPDEFAPNAGIELPSGADGGSTPEAQSAIDGSADLARSLRTLLISACLVVSSLGIAINAGFSESFSANMTCGVNSGISGESYSALRFYGAFGWCLASLVLSQVSEQSLGLPYLFVAWLLYLCFHGLTILLVLFWPDKRPFSLATELQQADDGPSPCGGHDIEQGISFGGQKSWRLFLKEPSDGLCTAVRRFSADMVDGKCSGPELRRNSIATLGSSHVIECFERADRNEKAIKVCEQSKLKRWSNRSDIDGTIARDEKNFEFITKIRPIEQVAKADLALALRRASETAAGPAKQKVSLRLIVKTIELIARRNPNVPRFMVLYVVVGFLVAMNWYFLFPYLEQLDPAKFRRLGPYVMISTYMSEMLFYFASARLPDKPVRPSLALSLVLLVFSLRYSSYLIFAQWPWWPLETIAAVELLQALTIAWFDCILNESAMEFALEAEHCLPELIELELIDGELMPRHELVELVRSSVKLTLVGVSSCFYDGIGVATGSLVGGWIIVRHDYAVLWTLSTGIGLVVSLANLLLEWVLFGRTDGGGGGGGGGDKQKA